MGRPTKPAKSKSAFLHANLVNVHGVGILIIGKSGIGKSECSLELLSRGHRLIADDVTRVTRTGLTRLSGTPAELLGSHMEIRGIGIIDARMIFGPDRVLEIGPIDLVAELLEWDPGASYNRLGGRRDRYRILGVPRPLVRIPVSPTRNPATLIEVVAKNECVKKLGTHSEKNFHKRVLQATSRTKSKV